MEHTQHTQTTQALRARSEEPRFRAAAPPATCSRPPLPHMQRMAMARPWSASESNATATWAGGGALSDAPVPSPAQARPSSAKRRCASRTRGHTRRAPAQACQPRSPRTTVPGTQAPWRELGRGFRPHTHSFGASCQRRLRRHRARTPSKSWPSSKVPTPERVARFRHPSGYIIPILFLAGDLLNRCDDVAVFPILVRRIDERVRRDPLTVSLGV